MNKNRFTAAPSSLTARLTLALILVAPWAQVAAESTASTDQITEEIVVVGIFEEPDRVTGSAHRVDEELLEVFRHDDVGRVLNFIPGVYTREEDGFGLRPNIGLRGGSSDRSQKVALMEDGVLFSPAPYSAPAAYFFPLTARMVGVEVFKGPSSIEFGPQTIGGAINLVSAPIPNDTEMEAALGTGSDGYLFGHLRGGTQFGEIGVLAEYIHVASDGFKDLDGGGDTGFEKNEFMFKADRDIGPGNLEIRLGYADEVSDETYLGLTEDDLEADSDRRYAASALDRMDWDWQSARATWTQPLGNASLRATAYVQTFERAWRKFNNFRGAAIRDVLANPDGPFNQVLVNILQGADTDGLGGTVDDIRIGTNDREFIASGIQGAINWSFGDRIQHDFEIGMRYHYDRIKRLHDEFGFEQTNSVLTVNNQGRAITANNTGETDAVALWIRDEMYVGRWTIVPGLRVESISNSFANRLVGSTIENDYVVVLPDIGTTFEVTPGLRLIAGVHKGFSPAVPSLTGDLEPEEAINYEIGARWQTELGQFELIGYYSDYDNLTAICTLSSGCTASGLDTQTNAGEVETQGIEAGWQHTFDLDNGLQIPLRLSYTYTDAEFGERFSSSNPQFGEVFPGYELPYVPPHRGNASIGLAGERWGVQVSVTYVDEMRDEAGVGRFEDGADASTIVDFATYYNFRNNWSITGRIDNATDEVDVVSRRPFGARPGKPFTFRVEVRYRFGP
ncbi:MAG: TonB-dependent receptor [Pseudomonadota bacterium]